MERTRVLIAGGGVAGLEAILALRALAAEYVSIELLAPEPEFWYRPLSVAEPFAAGTTHHLELAGVAHGAGGTFTPGALVAVDADRKVARASSGAEIPFDALVIASGAVPRPVLQGALTFRGPADSEKFGVLLAELERGSVRHATFVVPAETSWPIPLYELALMTASRLASTGGAAALALVTHEERPLRLFGAPASDAVEALLAQRGVRLVTSTRVSSYEEDALRLVPEGRLETQRVVTLPRLEGPPIEGIPRDANGFVPVDDFGRVRGLSGVFAAGDVTTFPIKQGGIAAQAADTVAEKIAEEAGAPVVARPFRPVLRGLVLTGERPAYLRADPVGGRGETPLAATEPLWWPPAKIVGRYLAPMLARSLLYAEAAPPAEGIAVEVDLEADPAAAA